MRERKTEISFFLTPVDEAAIAEVVVAALPAVRWVDNWAWESVDRPPVRESPLQCKREVGIWESALLPGLTGRQRANGKVDGPLGGAVVQWQRCARSGDVLGKGRWAVAYDADDAAVAAYVRKLWRLLKGETTDTLKRLSAPGQPPERRFRAGRDAFRAATVGELTLRADALVLGPE